MTGKPAAAALGIDLTAVAWRRPAGAVGGHDGAMEVGLAQAPDGASWVLLRVTGDPADRVLVYDRHEWECFLDGVRNGEFDVSD